MNLKSLIMVISTLLITSPAFSQATQEDVDQTPSRYSAYSESLKNCTPGTFKMIDMLTLAAYNTQKGSGSAPSVSLMPLNTVEIIGWDAEKCRVKTTTVVPANPQQGIPADTFVMNCLYSREALPKLASMMAQAALGNSQISTDDSSGKIMESSCTQEK